mgnify:CR=1 FL=1
MIGGAERRFVASMVFRNHILGRGGMKAFNDSSRWVNLGLRDRGLSIRGKKNRSIVPDEYGGYVNKYNVEQALNDIFKNCNQCHRTFNDCLRKVQTTLDNSSGRAWTKEVNIIGYGVVIITKAEKDFVIH